MQINIDRLHKIFSLFFIIFFFLIYTKAYAKQQKANLVKIAIKKNVSSITVSSKSRLTIITSDNKRKYFLPGAKIIISIDGSGLMINKEKAEPVKITSKNNHLYINGKGCRGNIDIRKTGKNRLLVINVIDVEDYTKGVLNNEVPSKWKLEVLKAQAVIARTYALYQKSQKQDELYHLEATVDDQVYRGSDTETKRSNMAVDMTSGKVLTYKNDLALAVYHSVCGGYTENADNVWTGKGAPYLEGVKCEFDRDAPNYYWEVKIPLSKVENLLKKEGITTGKIKKIEPIIFTKSGRIFRLEIDHTDGRNVIAGTDFRRIAGYDLVKSTLFKIDTSGTFAVLKGRGSGHGAGLCQWGAKGMAERGYNFEQILKHYYPGVKIVKWLK